MDLYSIIGRRIPGIILPKEVTDATMRIIKHHGSGRCGWGDAVMAATETMRTHLAFRLSLGPEAARLTSLVLWALQNWDGGK
jgi:hypothetical protein